MTHFRHWRDYPLLKWRWLDFTPAEIACKGDGSILVDEHALDCLQHARDIVGKPFRINSAYRSPVHNKVVGGAARSKHLKGIAFDIATHNSTGKLVHDRMKLYKACQKAGFNGFGFYPTFLHVDTRPRRNGEIIQWINGAPWAELEDTS